MKEILEEDEVLGLVSNPRRKVRILEYLGGDNYLVEVLDRDGFTLYVTMVLGKDLQKI